MRKTFSKKERLTGKKLINQLFAQGNAFKIYPLKAVYLHNTSSDPSCHQVLFAVSRKKFRKAVTRSLLKRRLREAYRLNKHIISDNLHKKEPFLIAFIYIAKEVHSFNFIESKVISALKKLENQ